MTRNKLTSLVTVEFLTTKITTMSKLDTYFVNLNCINCSVRAFCSWALASSIYLLFAFSISLLPRINSAPREGRKAHWTVADPARPCEQILRRLMDCTSRSFYPIAFFVLTCLSEFILKRRYWRISFPNEQAAFVRFYFFFFILILEIYAMIYNVCNL